jgi:hypothetical protein
VISTWNVCGQIVDERGRQHQKWGEQNHPDAVAFANQFTPLPRLVASSLDARMVCDKRHEKGHGSWLDILIEEVAEAADEAYEGNVEALRTELVQVAAVAVAWVEAIDRRGDA